jgi:hypothetical protein
MEASKVSQDILSNPMFQGTQDSIAWIMNWTQSGFGIVISTVAFLIILVAILKNVMAGLYCTYPKFFDKVDAVHRENEGIGWITAIQGLKTNAASINGGSVMKFFLGIMPNIKALTDFEDTQVAPKDYFMRAIPAGIAAICIGAFIYNGHYRDLAAQVTDFGSEVLSRTLLSFDPIKAYDDITASAGRPEFSTDKATDKKSMLINQISVETYKKIIGEYPDVKDKIAKAALARHIEEFVDGAFTGDAGAEAGKLAENEDWTVSVEVAKVTGTHDYSKVNKYDSTQNRYTYRFETPMSSFDLNSAKYNEDTKSDPCLQVSLSYRFTPKTGKSVTVKLNTGKISGNSVITLPGEASNWKGSSNSITIGSVKFDYSDGKLTGKGDNTAISSGSAVNGLYYTSSTGQKYAVQTVNVGAGSGLYVETGTIKIEALTPPADPNDEIKKLREEQAGSTQQ